MEQRIDEADLLKHYKKALNVLGDKTTPQNAQDIFQVQAFLELLIIERFELRKELKRLKTLIERQ